MYLVAVRAREPCQGYQDESCDRLCHCGRALVALVDERLEMSVPDRLHELGGVPLGPFGSLARVTQPSQPSPVKFGAIALISGMRRYPP